MDYDEWTDGREEQIEREHHAEAARMRREARAAFSKAARTMRRKVTVAEQPTPETIQHAGVILEPAGLYMSRAEIERMASEVATDYCGTDARRGIR